VKKRGNRLSENVGRLSIKATAVYGPKRCSGSEDELSGDVLETLLIADCAVVADIGEIRVLRYPIAQ